MADRDRDRGLQEYVEAMESAAGDIYTPDFIEGFKHAVEMVKAFEVDWHRDEGTARPEVRVAASLVLDRKVWEKS